MLRNGIQPTGSEIQSADLPRFVNPDPTHEFKLLIDLVSDGCDLIWHGGYK